MQTTSDIELSYVAEEADPSRSSKVIDRLKWKLPRFSTGLKTEVGLQTGMPMQDLERDGSSKDVG